MREGVSPKSVDSAERCASCKSISAPIAFGSDMKNSFPRSRPPSRRPMRRAPILKEFVGKIQTGLLNSFFQIQIDFGNFAVFDQLIGRVAEIVCAYSLAAKSSFVSPRSAIKSPSALKPCVTIFRASSIKPTIPMIGVGKIPRPSVSL